MLKGLLKVVVALLALLGLLVLVLALNTWRQGSRQVAVTPVAAIAIDEQAAAQSLAAAIQARTVSSLDDATLNADQFELLQRHLQSRYPQLHATLQREVVGGLSLLYTWPGSDPAAKADRADGAPGRGADRARHRSALAGERRSPAP